MEVNNDSNIKLNNKPALLIKDPYSGKDDGELIFLNTNYDKCSNKLCQ